MNIMILVDKNQSALYNLALATQKHNPHFNIKIQPFHPKHPDVAQVEAVGNGLQWADLVDVQYWKSGDKAKEMFPVQWANAKKILTHNNPYDIHQHKWDDYQRVIVPNTTMQNELPSAYLIEHGVDLDFFTWNETKTEDKTVNMVVARIESSKGVKEIAEVCNALQYKFILVGRVSDPVYMDDVRRAGGSYLDFRENINPQQLKDAYYQSAIHVCNSKDNFESGTLPILEAMACGTPVLTRSIGHVPDTYNGMNMEILDCQKEDIEAIKIKVKELVENPAVRERIRQAGWDTIKNRGDVRWARNFSKMYYSVLYKTKPMVSVIIPTYNRPGVLIKTLASVVAQSYTNLEIVVSDSGAESAEVVVNAFRNETKIPIKYIRFQREGYTLPEARNRAVIESQGDYLMFLDDRLELQPEAIATLETALEGNLHSWIYGMKDGAHKSFVENFSMIRRQDFVGLGMFCERINEYGGTTQELNIRFKNNGFGFIGIDGAEATSIVRTGGKDKRREQIIRSKDILFKLYGN